ncbi:MAG: hypothetical protein GKR99_06055 [Rhodobacteraceae bacterium]|nr:hypothetical protein [Paracoccaceae bacterium]
MQFVFHIGAHGTDAERLLIALRKNLARLGELDVGVPRPRIYRTLLNREALRLKGTNTTADEQAAIKSQILGSSNADRVIFDHDRFLGDERQAIANGTLYDGAQKTTWLRALFPDDQVEFALGIRNSATWVPTMFAVYGGDQSFSEFLNETDPHSLSWADLVQQIQDANPGCRIILWCNEDLPLIWPEVLRMVADLEDDEVVDGDTDILAEIMHPEGLKGMLEYIEARPPNSIAARREVTSAFLDKFVIEAEIEEEFDLPGWTPGLIAKLTRRYEADIEKLAQMKDVVFIRP